MADNTAFEKVMVVDHPVVVHKLTELRDKSTRPERFRDLVRDISIVLAVEATRDLPLAPRDVETSLAIASGRRAHFKGGSGYGGRRSCGHA